MIRKLKIRYHTFWVNWHVDKAAIANMVHSDENKMAYHGAKSERHIRYLLVFKAYDALGGSKPGYQTWFECLLLRRHGIRATL
jgi:hypothetical protein